MKVLSTIIIGLILAGCGNEAQYTQAQHKIYKICFERRELNAIF
ncbi:hypothetical protein [Campylobacter hyointestinalis]|nr:hypothetical protein [Campylobacter hyointestinalis]